MTKVIVAVSDSENTPKKKLHFKICFFILVHHQTVKTSFQSMLKAVIYCCVLKIATNIDTHEPIHSQNF